MTIHKQRSQGTMQRLANWLQDYLEAKWDRQIEKDAATGRLDALIAKADADIEAGNVSSLDKCLSTLSK